MPRYRVLSPIRVGGQLHPVGAFVEIPADQGAVLVIAGAAAPAPPAPVFEPEPVAAEVVDDEPEPEVVKPAKPTPKRRARKSE